MRALKGLPFCMRVGGVRSHMARASTSGMTAATTSIAATGNSETKAIHCRLTPFDQPHYLELNKARGATIRQLMATLKPILKFTTAMDVGCGLGFFSALLEEAGLTVKGFDGRLENV